MTESEDLLQSVHADVIIIGGGILGSTLAFYLTQKGAKPLVLDRTSPAAEASGANAGQIGASSGHPGTTLSLSILSSELYDAAMVEFDDPINFYRCGHLLLAYTPKEVAECEAFYKVRRDFDLGLEMVYGSDILDIDPALSSSERAAVWMPFDGKIDPFRATNAFLNAACLHGATSRFGVDVERIVVENGTVRGVVVDGTELRAERVVLAAGAWSGMLAATAGVELPIIPGRGQMLVTSPAKPLTSHVLRAPILGILQLDEGNLVIGSEVEYVGFNKDVDLATIARFCHLIADTVPGVGQVPLERTWSGLRPMTPDRLPILGDVPGVAGLSLLSGHGRSGMSVGPGSAFALAEQIADGRTSIPIDALSITRFADESSDPGRR